MEPPYISCRQLPAMGMKSKPKPTIICTHRAQEFLRDWIDNGMMFAFRTPGLGA